MATTTAARVSSYLAGTGVVLGATELSTQIADADLWWTNRLSVTGVTPASNAYNDSLELRAKSLWVLTQIQFAPFSFTKGPESKTVQFGALKAGWAWWLNEILDELGLATAGGQAVKGIESGTDYSTEDDELHVLTIVTY